MHGVWSTAMLTFQVEGAEGSHTVVLERFSGSGCYGLYFNFYIVVNNLICERKSPKLARAIFQVRQPAEHGGMIRFQGAKHVGHDFWNADASVWVVFGGSGWLNPAIRMASLLKGDRALVPALC